MLKQEKSEPHIQTGHKNLLTTNVAPFTSQPAKRATVRYPLHVKVSFHWSDIEGARRSGRGNTRNLSQKGAYVVSSECPIKDEIVAMIFHLPALAGDARLLRIEAEGRVLRVELARDSEGACIGFGFAVSHHRVTLCAN